MNDPVNPVEPYMVTVVPCITCLSPGTGFYYFPVRKIQLVIFSILPGNIFCSDFGFLVVRLWSLQLWTCLVVYKGHMYPVWDVKFAPVGYYFATSSHDRTARLWTTDNYQPLRIFSGHFSDVDVSLFMFVIF